MMKDLSLVIPVYNEEENLEALHQEITQTLATQPISYEVLYIDDGSHDRSLAVMKQLHEQDPEHVVAVQLRRNHGQTAAFAAGFNYAQGRMVVTMDADRQNNPADIPRMIAKLEEGYDVVNGWRENRQDAFLMRKLPSMIANRLIARLTHVPLRDRGCSLRLFRAEVVHELKLYGELHRFIPEMISFAGFNMAEVPVSHRPRVAGTSKYGISRTFRVVLDLITVLYLQRFSDRPMRLFGTLGFLFGIPGGLLGLGLAAAKIWAGVTGGWVAFDAYTLSDRPLLLLAVMMVILGVQFLMMGLIAELMVRTYYETQNKATYTIRQVIGGGKG